MKPLFLLPLFLTTLGSSIGLAQPRQIDSLKHQLAQTRQDTSRVLLMAELSKAYHNYSTDSSLNLAQQTIQLARQMGYTRGEGQALLAAGMALRDAGELPQALDYSFKALMIARTEQDRYMEAAVLNLMGLIHGSLGEDRKAVRFFQQALTINEALSIQERLVLNLGNMTYAYIRLNLLDSARYVSQQALRLGEQSPNSGTGGGYRNAGWLESLTGHTQEALGLYRKALQITYQNGDFRNQAMAQYSLATLFKSIHQPDSSLYYARLAFVNGGRANKVMLPEISDLLAQLYKSRGNLDSAYHYLEIARIASNSLFGPKKIQQLQLTTIAEQQRQQALLTEQKDYQNRVRLYTVLIGLAVLTLLAIILYYNNRQKQRANELLHQQKEEINHQRSKAEQALTELRTTQTQLIQREKMASLGELTAGIAHEIQNPLNFVNNFSELSTELMEELDQETHQGNTDQIKLIARDIKENLIKITRHGQRASSIVKGMLEHSRTSSGQKEPTNLNALADKYLRLAYQGLRAKDITFSCELMTDFAPDLPLANVVPQEIGRVLLNLYNNAFYAVSQKQKTAPSDYQPAVTVSTAQVDGSVQIRVKDNGTGIPESVKAKIFQPFFTTKPTGEGTGLGLSLSYDIVIKGHGGTLEVESVEGEGPEFIITIPLAKPV
jgi:two-component system NtrC family sensor kinase